MYAASLGSKNSESAKRTITRIEVIRMIKKINYEILKIQYLILSIFGYLKMDLNILFVFSRNRCDSTQYLNVRNKKKEQ